MSLNVARTKIRLHLTVQRIYTKHTTGHSDFVTTGTNLFRVLHCFLTATLTALVMSGQSGNLTTLFLGRLRPPKLLTSTLCVYFRQN